MTPTRRSAVITLRDSIDNSDTKVNVPFHRAPNDNITTR